MRLTFSLSIDSDQWLRFYSGHASSVRTRADNGKTLQLPANSLRPYILHNGIHGRFAVYFNAQHKLIKLERLPE